MGWKVLTTARAFWVSGQEAERQLVEAGCEVVPTPRPGPIPETELIEYLQDCDGVIASSDPYTERVFAACPKLKVVTRCGVGTDSVDMSAAASAGVIATNTPGAMSEAVADYTFGLMLSIARRIPEADALMRTGGWGEIRGVAIYDKTLGLIGLGRIGRAVAERARGFRMRVISYDPFMASLPESERPHDIEFLPFDEVLKQADFVSIHSPTTPDTLGIFNADKFTLMKRTAYLINTARGAQVNEPHLCAALHAGTIAGAALDVYAHEPLVPDHPLRTAPNTVLTPHNAFNAIESTVEMSRQSAAAIIDLVAGRRPDNVCNPDVWKSPKLRWKPNSQEAK